jgi:hypothetical protein
MTDEIEQCLAFHFDKLKKVVATAIQAGDPALNDNPPKSRTESTLRRVKARADTLAQRRNAPDEKGDAPGHNETA